MRSSKLIGWMCISAMLASCGGGGGDSPPPTQNPPPPPPVNTCSLDARMDWALDQLQEWYLFPDKLDTSVNKANHSTLQSFIDAVVKPARDDGIDRNFTYITSIEEETDFIETGTTQDYGWRPILLSNDNLFMLETFETGPAFGAGVDRGYQIRKLGPVGEAMKTPAEILANGGIEALANLVFPSSDGEQLQIEYATRLSSDPFVTATLTASDYELEPISPRYGVKIINNNGYLNLRTFFSERATNDLTDAFQQFEDAGVENIVIDLRYNGGGLVSVAEHLGNLLGEGRAGQVFSRTTFNNSKTANNDEALFEPLAVSQAPTRLSFITTSSSASASELIANSMRAYYGVDAALVGSDTFGKPVGQIAIERSACDDRLRVVAFRTVNANGEGDYYNGLASTFASTCDASDDWTVDLGETNEASLSYSLRFFESGQAGCVPLSSVRRTMSAGVRQLMPSNPTVAQRVVLGQL